MSFIIYGISSALCWGTSDFVGGFASRRTASYQVNLLVNTFGLVAIVPVLFFIHEQSMPLPGWLWCMAAGGLDSIALVILYGALAKGQLLAAPVTALTAAVLPVIAGILTDGMPKSEVLAGLALALVAVCLLSLNSEQLGFAGMRPSLLAGVFIGFFLIMMHKGAQQGVIWPIMATRIGGIMALLPYAILKGRPRTVEGVSWLFVVMIVVFDISGTVAYILAGQTGRLDIAAVLSSLYPGMTVFLSWLLLREKITKIHLVGVLAALGAVMLMARP
ncbi:MAG: EamA family transporter [Desulfuromonadaceae bacterium]|nr:EamA family transporter [Desulfuromonadaceae bacterium]MDD5105105.1 EamA family transporter [Desulfuromonadaceae bacterium]